MATAVAGITVRSELLGVTSIVRALGLQDKYYDRLLDAFHSPAINLNKLTVLWVKLVLKIFPAPASINGRFILIGDGIKVPKRGKKMPGVKKLHQESDSNTKPEYIMGHSFQAIALLVNVAKTAFAVPLISRIHEGLVFSNRDTRTLLDKMVTLIASLQLSFPFYFVADAYYSSRKIIKPLLALNQHLVSRVRSNAVAYQQPIQTKTKKAKGRPKKYGDKVKLKSLLSNKEKMESALSPIYGEQNVYIMFSSIDLLWRPLGHLVRFVAVFHPTRGKSILMCTDLSLAPIEIIRLYGLRYKIELAFKQAIRTIGAYAYHFWMASMKPLTRSSGNQHLHRESDKYRKQAIRKINAYHRFVQIGIIAQGLLQYLATVYPTLVWQSFGSWLRTIRNGIPPSELVTATTLRNSLTHFLAASTQNSIFAKFILPRIDISRSEGLRLAG